MFFDKEMKSKWEDVRSSMENAILKDDIAEFKKQKRVFLKLKELWFSAHKKQRHYCGLSILQMNEQLSRVVQSFFKVKVESNDNYYAPFTVLGLKVKSKNYKFYLSELAEIFGSYDKERLKSEKAQLLLSKKGSKKVLKDVEYLSMSECAAMQGSEYADEDLFERVKYCWELMLKEKVALSERQYYINNVLFCLATNYGPKNVVNYVLEQGAEVNYMKVVYTKDGYKKFHVIEEALRTGGNVSMIDALIKSEKINWSYKNLSNETILQIMIKKVMSVSYSKDDPMIDCLKQSIEKCSFFEEDSSYAERLISSLNFYSSKRSSFWHQSVSNELEYLINKSAAIGQGKKIEAAILVDTSLAMPRKSKSL